jgi:regulator of sigma E protease
MSTLPIVVLVFGAMIFLHELGHFLAARFFKIPVEEFGFGMPPRLFRFWRAKGSIKVGRYDLQIPANFELPFERADGLRRAVDAVAVQVNEKLILKSISLAVTEDGQAVLANPEMRQMPDGTVRLSGIVQELDPGTEFTLNWLPLGGFVRPRGEDNPDIPDGLAAANPWQRLVVLFAGPLMNILTAVIVYSIVVFQMGMPITNVVLVDDVSPDSPAQQAGFVSQDILLSINGQKVTDIEMARSIIRENVDTQVSFDIERNGQQLTLSAMPLSSRTPEQGAMGVLLSNPSRPATIGESLLGGVTMTGLQSVSIITIPVAMMRGLVAPEEARLIGLKGIYDTFDAAIARDAQTRQETAASPTPSSPTSYTLLLIGMLSVSLGVMNLLPIPALDGGRILFTLPEIIFRRRIPARFEMVVNGVAFMLLIGLMLFINVMDFIRPVQVVLP